MKKHFSLVLAFLLILSTSCSGDDEVAEDNRTTITGHSGAIAAEDLSPEQTLSALTTLWMEAGASKDLAECYSDLFESNGLAEAVNTLEDLASVQAEFTDEQKKAFGDCGSLQVETTPPSLSAPESESE